MRTHIVYYIPGRKLIIGIIIDNIITISEGLMVYGPYPYLTCFIVCGAKCAFLAGLMCWFVDIMPTIL